MSSETVDASGLAGRYATALFELADERSALDQVSDELVGLNSLIQESSDLKRLITSPVMARDVQERAMAAVMDKAGMSEITRNFVGLISRNRRLAALSDIIRAYRALLAERRGEVTAEVVSARPLSESQREKLEGSLRRTVGGKVAIESSVDAGLIGGMIVKVGSRMVDTSVRTKLQKLQLALKGAA